MNKPVAPLADPESDAATARLKLIPGRIAALRQANIYERHSYRHIIGMPSVRSEAEGMIVAETPFLIVRTMRDGKMDLFAAGLYRDRLRQATDGGLRFAERIVVCDSPRFDTLVAIPF